VIVQAPFKLFNRSDALHIQKCLIAL